MTTFEQLIFSEFDGSNYEALATKYRTPVRKIYRIIRLAAQTAMREALQANAGNHLEILWVDQADRLARLNGCVAVLEAAQKALDSHRLDHAVVALVALPLAQLPTVPGSNLGGSSSASAKTQQGTPGQTSLYPSSSSLSPFTQFLGRLVELVGTENAAQLTREFAGQTIQFPVTDHYDTKPRDDFGFPASVPVLGARYNPLPVADAKALADKLVQESNRANDKKLMTHSQAAHLLRERMQAPASLQCALQSFLQEILTTQSLESPAQCCCCQRAARSPSPAHPADLGDEGGN